MAAVLVSACFAVYAQDPPPEKCPGCWRDFRIVDLDSSGKVDRREDPLKVTEFSTRLFLGELNGKPVSIYSREERTDKGYKVRHTLVMKHEDLRPLESTRSLENAAGDVVSESRTDYRDPVYKHAPNTFPMEALGMVAHRLDLRPGAVNDCFILYGPGHLSMRITLTVEDEEAVTVPAGTFQCLRLRLEYGYEQFLGERWAFAAGILKPFSPDYFIWVEKDPPHGMIKIQGKFGAPGSVPLQAHELLRIRKQ
jgi:hypothetical protein